MRLNQDSLHKPFAHVYVEESVMDYPDTKAILTHFDKSVIIPIRHYKDVFNRPRQNVALQSKCRNLILAQNTGAKLFMGAPVCQDFGYDNFMYTASVQGCIYNCDYCFLKGMYATGNVVIFVNFEDYVKDVLEACAKEPVYLCASYDTDLQALRGIIDYSDRWARLAARTPNLTVEIRTKAAKADFIPHERVIYAFSISPDEIVSKYEHGTASLDRRISNVVEACEMGCQVRLCFDPMVYTRDYEACYNSMMDKVLERVDFGAIKDVSIGTVRISSDYIKKFRRISPDSAAVQFPFEKKEGYCVYPDALNEKMTGLIRSRLEGVFDNDRIFVD